MFVAAGVAIGLAGCGSEPATANNSAGEGDSAVSADSATKPPPAASKQPGALTKALSAAGDRPYDKTFDDIRFDMNPADDFVRSMITPQIEALAGQRIRIRGYIYPTPQKRGIRQFVLVRDNQECCFGQGAALYDCILVEMAEGKSAEYTIRPVAVEGTFEIREFAGPDGRPLAIYRLVGESVQ
jgi:hypothetical protein